MNKSIIITKLPEEMQCQLTRKYWTKINYIPLREMSFQTGLSINTLRNIRYTKSASYATWQKLIDRL